MWCRGCHGRQSRSFRRGNVSLFGCDSGDALGAQRDELDGEDFAERSLEADAGLQQQLYYLRSELRRLRDRVRAQVEEQKERHAENRERLDELDKVINRGNGELSLVRKMDGVQASLNQIIDSRKLETEKRHWAISDVAIPVIAIIVVILDHFWK